jgi:hypothetical protein
VQVELDKPKFVIPDAHLILAPISVVNIAQISDPAMRAHGLGAVHRRRDLPNAKAQSTLPIG